MVYLEDLQFELEELQPVCHEPECSVSDRCHSDSLRGALSFHTQLELFHEEEAQEGGRLGSGGVSLTHVLSGSQLCFCLVALLLCGSFGGPSFILWRKFR